jgi:hypothetical protein
MVEYSPVIPINYREIRSSIATLDETVLDRKVPPPALISKILGEGAVPDFYFMDALNHSLEYNPGTDSINRVRRDGKPPQRHPLDVVLRPLNRLEYEIPSGYMLTPREVNGGLVHDSPEDFGRTLLGAQIVINTISYLLGEKSGRDADLLTDRTALLYKSLENEIRGLPNNRDTVDEFLKKVDEFLGEKKEEVASNPVSHRDIERERIRVSSALQNFATYVSQEVDYLPKEQKEYLVALIDRMENQVMRMEKEGVLIGPDKATQSILATYDNFRRVVKEGNLDEIDKLLLTSGESNYLSRLKSSLYRDYIRSITAAAIAGLSSTSEHEEDDGPLAPVMEKLSDNTDTVWNMDPTPLENASSIFRKAEIIIASGVELGHVLKEQYPTRNIDFQRLERAVSYLVNILNAKVSQHLSNAQINADGDNSYAPDLRLFTFMGSRKKDLEWAVSSLGRNVEFSTASNGL